MGRTPKPIKKTGLRPHDAARRLAASATGIITSWAAMMQADMTTAAPSLRPSLDF